MSTHMQYYIMYLVSDLMLGCELPSVVGMFGVTDTGTIQSDTSVHTVNPASPTSVHTVTPVSPAPGVD